MGRPRKPLTEQRGNLTVITMQTREAEEDSVTTDKNQLKRPPTWLIDNVAKKEWRRIVKELEKINLIGNLDRNNLGGYCNAFANYVKAIVVKNPMVDIQRTYAEEMRKFASLCGLTIDARLKAAAVKSDKTREAITNKFGNI